MEEEDHFTLLYSQLIFTALAAAAMAARLLPLQLSFSPHSCTHSRFSLSTFSFLSLCSQLIAAFIGIKW
jgi:hypothetical protein